jgi:hypothetical protein
LLAEELYISISRTLNYVKGNSEICVKQSWREKRKTIASERHTLDKEDDEAHDAQRRRSLCVRGGRQGGGTDGWTNTNGRMNRWKNGDFH